MEEILKARLVSLPTAAAAAVPSPGDGPVMFADSSAAHGGLGGLAIKTPDGQLVELMALATASVDGRMSASDKSKLDSLQSGVATLVDGVTALIAATITSSSRVFGFLKTVSGTTLTVKYAALSGDRVVGAAGAGGGFKLTALVAAGTINVADQSTLDWLVLN